MGISMLNIDITKRNKLMMLGYKFEIVYVGKVLLLIKTE